MKYIKMVDYINPWDNGKVAREKINAMLEEVQANIPSIWQNWNWYIWWIDTWIPATWPRWPQGKQGIQWPQWKTWPQWPAWVNGKDWADWKDGKDWKNWADWQPWYTPIKWVDYFTQEDIASLNIPTKVSDLSNDKNFSSMDEVTEDEWGNIEDRMTNNVNYFIYE